MQMINAAAKGKLNLTLFSPATLRSALRAAGNVLKPEEVEEVLQYVIKDKDFADLDGLYLVHLVDNSVKRLAWHNSVPVHLGKRFFLAGDGDSQSIYDLMSVSAGQLVKPSQAWKTLSGCV